MDEQTPMPDIATWVMRQEQTVHTEQVKFELHEAAERAKRDEARRNPPSVPELDPGPAAGAFALLVCGMLILADRRRANSARRSPTGGVSG